jgi:hypothetical protein
MGWRLPAATKSTRSRKVPNTYSEGAVIGANLIATAARSQNVRSDERVEGHQLPKCDYRGRAGFRNGLSEETIIQQKPASERSPECQPNAVYPGRIILLAGDDLQNNEIAERMLVAPRMVATCATVSSPWAAKGS